MRYCAILFWLNQLCIHWVVQRNERGLAQALLAPNNQAAVLQFSEYPCGALAAAVELRLRLLQGEVQPNCAVRLDVPDEQLAKLREDVDAARREFHASKEALDTMQSPCPGLLAGMHVFAKAGRNAKDPVSRMMADMTAMMLRMMIQQVLAEERRRQREEAERRVYESRRSMWDAEKRLKAAEKALSNEDEREVHLKRERTQRRAEKAEQRVGVRTPRSADKDTQFGE